MTRHALETRKENKVLAFKQSLNQPAGIYGVPVGIPAYRRRRVSRFQLFRRRGGPGLAELGIIPGFGGGRLAPGLDPDFDPLGLSGMGNPFEPTNTGGFKEYSRNIQTEISKFAFPNRNLRLGVTYVYDSSEEDKDDE